MRSVGPDRLGPLLLAVVDPTRFDRATSIDLVTSLINVFDRYREAAEGVRGILGQFIGPWLIEFVPLPAGRTSHDPRLDPTIGDPAWGRVRRLDLLRWIARDERSALALDVWSQVWTSAGVVSVLQAGGDTAGPLRDLGLKVGEVADAVRDATIDEASERESAWKVVFGFGVEVAASSVATAAGLSGGVPGFVAAEGLKAVTLAVGSGPLRRLFGIVPAGVVAGNELARARAEAVQFMSTIAALCYEHAIAGERLDPSAPPIPLPAPGELATIGLDEVQQRMLHWVAEGDGPASVAERRLVYDDVAIATEGFLESFSKLGWTMQRAMPR